MTHTLYFGDPRPKGSFRRGSFPHVQFFNGILRPFWRVLSKLNKESAAEGSFRGRVNVNPQKNQCKANSWGCGGVARPALCPHEIPLEGPRAADPKLIFAPLNEQLLRCCCDVDRQSWGKAFLNDPRAKRLRVDHPSPTSGA